jgi:rhamnosyltransferase
MDVSIVIRTLNEAKWLPDLLEGIRSQAVGRRKIETVIVDSGSTDGTVEIAQRYGCRIVYIDKTEFTFGRSLNFGCDAALGDTFVFISGHCVPVGTRWLSDLCAPVEDGQCAYSYGRQIGRAGHSKFSECQLFVKYFPDQSAMPQEGFFCNNANAAISRAAWSRYKFNEELTGLEDMALAKYIWLEGEKIGYVSTAEVEHIHDESWPQIMRRYEREAIALQGIMPEIHVNYVDFVRYLLAAIWADGAAARKRGMLIRCVPEIIRFRLMQYWGTFRGNNNHRKLSQKAKEAYFYPK